MRVELVYLSSDYLDFLCRHSEMKGDRRHQHQHCTSLYVKIPGSINGHTYYAPLCQPRSSDYTEVDGIFRPRESSLTIQRLMCKNDYTGEPELKATVLLSHMVPAPEECVSLYDPESCRRSSNYKAYVQKEENALRKCIVTVTQKAKKVHENKSKSKALEAAGIFVEGSGYLGVTLDFLFLEELCKRYSQHLNRTGGGLKGAAAAPGGPVGEAANRVDDAADEHDGAKGGYDVGSQLTSGVYSLWGDGSLGVAMPGEPCKPAHMAQPQSLWRYSGSGGGGDCSLWSGGDLSAGFAGLGLTEADGSPGGLGAIGDGRNEKGAVGGEADEHDGGQKGSDKKTFPDGSVRKKIFDGKSSGGRNGDKDDKPKTSSKRYSKCRRL